MHISLVEGKAFKKVVAGKSKTFIVAIFYMSIMFNDVLIWPKNHISLSYYATFPFLVIYNKYLCYS